jgi:hypothetical protein
MGGQANSDGLACEMKLTLGICPGRAAGVSPPAPARRPCCERTLWSLLSPMTAVGVNASDSMLTSGYQYQYCVNTSSPTMGSMRAWPDRDCSEIVTFRPPATVPPRRHQSAAAAQGGAARPAPSHRRR